MYEIKIEGHEGYDRPFKEDSVWNIGDLLRTLIKTFGGEVTVTVSNDMYKQQEDKDDSGNQ